MEGWVPFRITANRVILDGRLNDRPVAVVLDSGAGRTTMDAGAAPGFGLHSSSTLIETGVTGETRAALTGPARLELPGLRLGLPAVALADLSALTLPGRASSVVVLGQDLLDVVALSLSFQTLHLQISRPGPAPLDPGYDRAPLLPGAHHRRHIPFRLGEATELQAMVDLGNDAPLYLSPRLASDLKLLEGRKHSLALSVGAEGRSVDTVFTTPSLTLGGATLKNVPTRVPSKWTVSVPAVIGLPVLSRYDIRFCYDLDEIALRADPTVIAQPFARDRSGLGAIMDGHHLRIIFVSPASPASRAALQVGDEIKTIEGVSVKQYLTMANGPLGSRSAGTRFDLGLSDGRRVPLVLRDYF